MLRTKIRFTGVILALVCGMLAFSLTACFGFGDNGSQSSKPTATPSGGSKSGNPGLLTPTPVTLVDFNGSNFSLKYPQNWKVAQESGGVTFTDPNGIAYFSVHNIPNPNGLVSSSQQVQLGLKVFQSQAKQYQTQSIASTTTVGGQAWAQGSATGMITSQGASVPARVIVLSTNYPQSSANTQGFTIAYATADQIFSLADSTAFQPMLHSFTFHQ